MVVSVWLCDGICDTVKVVAPVLPLAAPVFATEGPAVTLVEGVPVLVTEGVLDVLFDGVPEVLVDGVPDVADEW